MIARINGRYLVAAALVVVIAGCYLAFYGGSSNRTVTAYFSQAISVYKGTDVDVMGVRVGQVTSVVPDGDQVRVTMEYSDNYRLPAGVKAAVITPTLVSDRFVQLAPAYGGGPALSDGGSIPMARTAVPLELDKIYSSLGELTKQLGPEGVNKTGALSALLRAGAKALKGNGELGNQTLANLSRAVQTFGDNSEQIFGTVDNLASITTTLQANDKFVGQFMDHLAAVSTELAGERGDLRKALVAIAGAVDTVRGFVHDNRKALVTDVKQLTTTVGVLAKEKNTLAKVIQLAPLGLGNLGEAFDVRTGTVGIRLQLGPTASDLGNILCQAITVNNAAVAAEACPLLKALLPTPSPSVGAGLLSSSSNPLGGLTSGAPVTGLGGLLGVKGKL